MAEQEQRLINDFERVGRAYAREQKQQTALVKTLSEQ